MSDKQLGESGFGQSRCHVQVLFELSLKDGWDFAGAGENSFPGRGRCAKTDLKERHVVGPHERL